MTGRRGSRAALLFIALCSTQSCASIQLGIWANADLFPDERTDLGFRHDAARGDSISSAILKPLAFLAAVPFTLAWDIVTFPVQVSDGYYPYGNKWRPESTKR